MTEQSLQTNDNASGLGEALTVFDHGCADGLSSPRIQTMKRRAKSTTA